ncbi:MAG TPA: hypothetical protein VK177_16880 [Flavobacteriales bacterium]|nr:hypothetical protein [Flavobacteriales bacterium]
MKKLILLMFLFPNICFGNIEIIDSLKFINKIPNCEASAIDQPDSLSLFWRIASMKELAIPTLIQKISDTTRTNILIPHFGGTYRVGDIAFRILEELIIKIPKYKLLGAKFDKNGCGDCAYWNAINGYENRKKFEVNLQKWYDKNKSRFVWKELKWNGTECNYHNFNKGHYEIK